MVLGVTIIVSAILLAIAGGTYVGLKELGKL